MLRRAALHYGADSIIAWVGGISGRKTARQLVLLTSQGSGGRPWKDVPFDLPAQGVLRDGQVVLRLEIHPHLGGGAKVSAQPQGSVSGNASLALDEEPIRFAGTRKAGARAFTVSGVGARRPQLLRTSRWVSLTL